MANQRTPECGRFKRITMSIKTTLLAFAGGVYAAKLYQKSRAGGGLSTSGEGADASAADDAPTPATTDADISPNAGERLRQDISNGSPLARSPGLAQALDEGNLFTPNPGQGTDSTVPGVPDFARGA
jgi:hypothetical protein